MAVLYPIKSHDPLRLARPLAAKPPALLRFAATLPPPLSNGEKIFCSIMEENPLIVAFHSGEPSESEQRGKSGSGMSFHLCWEISMHIPRAGRLYYDDIQEG